MVKCVHEWCGIFLILLSAVSLYAKESADIVVDASGSGDYTSIMEALQSIPQDNKNWVTVYIKNGHYNEHVFIDRSFIALVGESRDETIISFSINRDDWYSTHRTNAGSAVIDIGVAASDGVSGRTAADIVIANLTIENTFNNTGVKTHVIRGESGCNRVSVVHCNIWCKGHDTIALWNKAKGMYYHANCSFKGSVDAVCPRGWCYTVGCEFYEGTSSSPLWHEVAAGSTQKFVIRKGYFGVTEGNNSSFRLLNMNNSSSLGTRYFLLDCLLSDKAGTKGNCSEAYFHNCHGESRDQSWYADNLSKASGSPPQEKVTAYWTFDKQWDPENTLPAVLPFPSLPQPWDEAYDVESEVELRWINGRNATKSLLYFGTENPPPFYADVQDARAFSPGKLASATYYWRVDAVNGSDTVSGATWSFTTVPGVACRITGEYDNTAHTVSLKQINGTLVLSGGGVLNAAPEVLICDLLGKVIAVDGEFRHRKNSSVLMKKLPAGVYAAQWRCGTDRGLRCFVSK